MSRADFRGPCSAKLRLGTNGHGLEMEVSRDATAIHPKRSENQFVCRAGARHYGVHFAGIPLWTTSAPKKTICAE